jgi:trigger factor
MFGLPFYASGLSAIQLLMAGCFMARQIVKVTTQTLENRQVEMVIEVEDERVQQALQHTAKHLAQKINIPGFRKGKAPYPIVLRTVGEPALYEEMLGEVSSQWVEEALKEADLGLYHPVEMSDLHLKPLSFKVIVPLPPVVELGDYRSLRVPYELPVMPEDELDKVLQDIRERSAVLEPAGEGPAEWGQIAALHITGTTPDNQVLAFSHAADEGDSINLRLDEATTFPVPGFVAQIVGMKVGQEKTFSLPVPDDFEDEALRGQALTFVAKLEDLKTRYVPPLDDALAQTVSNYETLDELRKTLRSGMEQRLRAQADEAYANTCVERLTQAAQVDFPPFMLEEELDKLLKEVDQRLQRQKMSLEELLNIKKQSEEDYRQEMKPRAAARLKQTLALVKFIETEGLASKDGQIDEGVAAKAMDRLVSICKGEPQDVQPA